MFLQVLVLATLAVVEITLCIPLNEKIQPVELKYQCLHIEPEDEKPTKSPVLLIHCLTASHKNWGGLYEVLAHRTKRRVCAVDLRNHGDSPWDNRTDVEAMAVDVSHFLDKQNITKVNIIGHSLGGKTGVHFALKNPDRVDSLVVEDMRPNGITKVALDFVQSFVSLLQTAIDQVPKDADEDKAKRSIVDYLMEKLKEPENIDREKVSEALEIHLVDGKWQWKMNLKVLEKALGDPEYLLTESSGLYTGPALFIYGADSPFDVGEDKENILRLFPRAKLIPVEGAGHLIHGRFRQFDDEVIKFLNESN